MWPGYVEKFVLQVAFVAVTDCWGSEEVVWASSDQCLQKESHGELPWPSISVIGSPLWFALCLTCDDRVILKPTHWLGICTFNLDEALIEM